MRSSAALKAADSDLRSWPSDERATERSGPARAAYGAGGYAGQAPEFKGKMQKKGSLGLSHEGYVA